MDKKTPAAAGVFYCSAISRANTGVRTRHKCLLQRLRAGRPIAGHQLFAL